MSPENNIQKNVLEKIHKGSVSMHSPVYFIVHTILIGLVAILALAASSFVLSFVFFSVHESGVRYLLEFSEQGVATFISLFPWTLFLTVLALFGIVEVLLRTFKFGYQSSLLHTFLWLVIIGIVGSQLLSLTPLHSFLLSEADNGRLPVLGSLYEQIHDSHKDQGIYRGYISSISESAFVISYSDTDKDSDDGVWYIIPPAGFSLGQLTVGDKVYVAGRPYENIIYAYGIHRIGDIE